MEKFSENKRGRGRPKSEARQLVDRAPDYAKPSRRKCLRSEVGWGYEMIFLNHLIKGKDTDQLTILGCSVKTGITQFPHGYKQAAEAAGRWIDAGNDPQETIEIMADARSRGVSFSEIAYHFRSLRLGKPKGGNLILAIAQTIDRFCKHFPETTPEEEWNALAKLLEIVEERIKA
jgi:hypothetical protein